MDTEKKTKKRRHKPIQRKKEYKIPDNLGEGISSETAYNYIGRPYAWWWKIISPVRGRLTFAFLLSAIIVSLTTVVPAVVGKLIDDVYGKGELSKILPYSIIIVAVPIFRSLIGLISRGIYENSSQNTVMRLRAGIYKHLQDLDQTFFNKTSVGDIMARMTGDLDMVRHFTAYVAMALFEQIILFTVGMIFMFSISPILALSTLAFAPPIIIIANKFRKEVRPVWSEVRQQFSRLNAVTQENIAGNRVTKAFVRKEHEIETFEKENDGYRNINLKSVKVWLKYIPALEGISQLLTVPVILVGGILVIKGNMSLGELVAFNGILFVVSTPMRMIGGLMNEIQRFAASAEKIVDILHQRSRITSPISGRAASMDVQAQTEVEFNDVSFRYSNTMSKKREEEKNDNKLVLKNINFKVKRGQRIGIVGATGSGKTTLVNLIMRFYDATSGEVKIRGENIKKYDLNDLRSKIGIVMQEVFLFSDTVEGNIAYGKPAVSFDRVKESAISAAADEFILSMSDGYDTIVGERGVGLSGGQKQRISLARALCFDPDIVILDDTTSAIDMETEFKIQNHLDKSLKGKTVFTVAHRISSVRNSDLILVLDHGRIVENGTHDELIKLEGIYYDVYLTQSGLIYDKEVSENGKK